MRKSNRDLAQLVAHVVRDDGVAGSSPVIPTTFKKRIKKIVLVRFIIFYESLVL